MILLVRSSTAPPAAALFKAAREQRAKEEELVRKGKSRTTWPLPFPAPLFTNLMSFRTTTVAGPSMIPGTCKDGEIRFCSNIHSMIC